MSDLLPVAPHHKPTRGLVVCSIFAKFVEVPLALLVPNSLEWSITLQCRATVVAERDEGEDSKVASEAKKLSCELQKWRDHGLVTGATDFLVGAANVADEAAFEKYLSRLLTCGKGSELSGKPCWLLDHAFDPPLLFASGSAIDAALHAGPYVRGIALSSKDMATLIDGNLRNAWH